MGSEMCIRDSYVYCGFKAAHLLAAPVFGALSIVAPDVFGIVDLVVTIRTFVGVAVDFLRG